MLQIEEIILAKMEPPVRDLFARVSQLDRGCLILRLLFRRANVVMTIDDVAYHVAEPKAIVENSIHAMVEIGLAREIVVEGGPSFFGLTKDQELRQTIRELMRWQDLSHRRLAQIGRAVDGHAAH